MVDITAVVPAYTLNDQIQALTEAAIASVGDVPLVVIDNASPQGGGYLRKMATTYVRNSVNLGFAKACNQGVKLATTRYVAIVSTDVVLSPNWQQVAYENFNEDMFSLHFRMTDYGVPFAYGNQFRETGKERWCTAATFVLDKQKGLFFDEDYFNSYEDWTLFHEARKAGYKTAYTDKACFQHQHSFTQRFTGFAKTDENKHLFIKKYGDTAENLFARDFPEQVAQPYWEGFNI